MQESERPEGGVDDLMEGHVVSEEQARRLEAERKMEATNVT